ncbi:hypothetical protein CBS14141_000356 [Malassezia furfur]|nr:hypothetical protein CBS14141_000356 [Malassezia furfur]
MAASDTASPHAATRADASAPALGTRVGIEHMCTTTLAWVRRVASALLTPSSGAELRARRPANADADAVRRAYETACAADDGATAFAEKFKYIVATSFLLTPTLSISMYGTDAPPSPAHARRPAVVEERGHYDETARISGTPPLALLVVVAGIVVLFAAVQCEPLLHAYVPLHVFLLAVTIGTVELVRLVLLHSAEPSFLENTLGPRTVACTLSRAPDATRPRYLATGVPVPTWVADERARIQAQALRLVAELVRAAHAMDRSLNAALAAVQEVEVVARGLSLSTPLPPISRLEDATLESDGESSGAISAPTEPRGVYRQRLTPLRKAFSEHVEQVRFHCLASQRRLAPLVHADVLEQSLRCITPQRVMSPTHVPLERAPSGSALTPRSFALASSLLTPPRKGMHLPPMSPVPRRARSAKVVPAELGGSAPDSDATDGAHSSADEADESRLRARPPRTDRLALSLLRARFEHMHVARAALLYHFLALDFSLHAPRDDPRGWLHAYWDDAVLRELAELAELFGTTAARMDAQLQTAIGLPLDAEPPALSLHKHLGLADRMVEMGRMLRTIQCKLHVCAEELSLPPVTLHGTPSAPSPPSPSVETMFNSMRNDLLALSSEWEAGLRIVQTALHPAPPAQRTPSPPRDTIPDAPWAAASQPSPRPRRPQRPNTIPRWKWAPTFRATRSLRCCSTRPTRSTCRRPGVEEVFEGDTHVAPRATLSRAERIARMHERRQQAAPVSPPRPLAMVSELKGVLAHRHAAPRSP